MTQRFLDEYKPAEAMENTDPEQMAAFDVRGSQLGRSPRRRRSTAQRSCVDGSPVREGSRGASVGRSRPRHEHPKPGRNRRSTDGGGSRQEWSDRAASRLGVVLEALSSPAADAWTLRDADAQTCRAGAVRCRLRRSPSPCRTRKLCAASSEGCQLATAPRNA